MKVILRDEVKSLGKIGEIVKVKPGFGRNYLIPQGMAVEANEKNMRSLEHEKRVVAARARKLHLSAQAVADAINAASVTLKAKAGEEGKLFGSVTSMDIADALKAKGIEIDKRKIDLAEPIKALGEQTVGIKLGHDVTASLKVTVEAE